MCRRLKTCVFFVFISATEWYVNIQGDSPSIFNPILFLIDTDILNFKPFKKCPIGNGDTIFFMKIFIC